MASSRTYKLMQATSILGISVFFHVAGVAAFFEAAPEVQIEGGTAENAASIGNSFQDLVQGAESVKPAEVIDETAQTPPSPIEPLQSEQPIKPSDAPTVQPQKMAALTSPAVETLQSKPIQTLDATPTQKLATEPIKPLQSTPVPETLAAIAPSQNITSSEVAPVPVSKPPALKAKPKRDVVVKKRKKPAPAKKQAAAGNSSKQAKRGNASGAEKAKGATQGKAARRATKAGNAAVSNYPGKVYRRISRTRKKGIGEKGKVNVRFSIADSGAITSLTISRSSGSAKVDKAALDHVKRSAPFPKPPVGAQKSFVIPIEIRS